MSGNSTGINFKMLELHEVKVSCTVLRGKGVVTPPPYPVRESQKIKGQNEDKNSYLQIAYPNKLGKLTLYDRSY